jgi:hypothetical protein
MRSNRPGWTTWLETRERWCWGLREGCFTIALSCALRAGAAEPEPAPPPVPPRATPPAPSTGQLPPAPAPAPPAAAAPAAPETAPPVPPPFLPLAPAPPSVTPAPPAPAPPLAENEDVERARLQLEQRIRKLAPPGVEPCTMLATLEVARRTFVACGTGGVWVVELAAEGDRLISRSTVAGRAVGLFSRNGRVWVEIETLSARPLPDDVGAALGAVPEVPQLSLAEAPAPCPPAPRPPPERATSGQMSVAILGTVLSEEAGRLVVDLGSSHGVDLGDRIELSVLSNSPLGQFQNRDVLAVGRVTSVTEERSLVELGVGEQVPLGAEAALSKRPLTASRIAPPRVPGVWSLSAIIRPFFVLDQFGVGTLNELAASYRAQGVPLRFQLLSSPLGFSSADDGSTFSAAGMALLSFDTRLFELGLGAGAQTINDSEYESGSGITVAQTLRIGSLDGLNLTIRNDISLFHREFEYSAFNGLAQVPVADRGWFLLQGGGGTVGYGFFEVGGKVLVAGNGSKGSLFLRGTIGYAALYETTDDFVFNPGDSFQSDLEHTGPLVGFGVEWRR